VRPQEGVLTSSKAAKPQISLATGTAITDLQPNLQFILLTPPYWTLVGYFELFLLVSSLPSPWHQIIYESLAEGSLCYPPLLVTDHQSLLLKHICLLMQLFTLIKQTRVPPHPSKTIPHLSYLGRQNIGVVDSEGATNV